MTLWLALLVFAGLVSVWRSVMVKHGKLAFWQIVADYPDEAYEWFLADPDTWIFFDKSDPQVSELKSQSALTGPFSLWSPKMGRSFAVFADEDRIVGSQDRFVEKYGSQKYVGPSWLSFLSLGYPIVAMLWIGSDEEAFASILGYGMANLGYLLLVAGLVPGHFRALGLTYRSQTLSAAAICWVAGILLSNI